MTETINSSLYACIDVVCVIMFWGVSKCPKLVCIVHCIVQASLPPALFLLSYILCPRMLPRCCMIEHNTARISWMNVEYRGDFVVRINLL